MKLKFCLKDAVDAFKIFANYIFKTRFLSVCSIASVTLLMLDIGIVSSIPSLFKNLVETLNSGKSAGMITLFFSAAWASELILRSLQEIVFFPVINEAVRDIKRRTVEKVHKIPFLDYQNLSTFKIISAGKRISGSTRTIMKFGFLKLVPSIIKLIISTFIVIKVGSSASYVVPMCLAVSFVFLSTLVQWYAKIRALAWKITDDLAIAMGDSILNTKQARASLDFEMRRVTDFINTEAELWQQTNNRQHLVQIFLTALSGISIFLALLGGVYAVFSQKISIGTFILLKGHLVVIFMQLRGVSSQIQRLVEACVDVKKIVDVLKMPNQEDRRYVPAIKTTNSTAISVRNMSFAYPGKDNLFKNFCMEISRGEKVGLVGSTGSGKSTLAKILVNLMPPNTGNLKILSPQTHLVHQETRLLNASLYDNITYDCKNASHTQIRQVLQEILLEDFVFNLKDKLKTRVGDLGMYLSGGQIQRIALAQAILKKPQILILDEATCALDVGSEKEIIKALYKNIETVLLISHRPSTLNFADKIIKL
ncbi:ABC transporter ATP-binding protein [Candidatus Dependentiae bacterium]